jgi:nucleoside-diphosphate-sugar epimerase
VADLRNADKARQALGEWMWDEVYALAADMGGMGFISSHHAQILRNNALININTLDAARAAGASSRAAERMHACEGDMGTSRLGYPYGSARVSPGAPPSARARNHLSQL